jgi:uncharacterized protein
MKADDIIRELALRPHPEGGFYAETFRSEIAVESGVHDGSRSASTAIYFLLRSGDFSALHRVRSDEVWHHYHGDSLELVMLHEDGRVQNVRLGSDLSRGERPQWVVPANVFQAARPFPGAHGYALCGCTVAPGFEFRDFSMPTRAELVSRFVAHAELVSALTR